MKKKFQNLSSAQTDFDDHTAPLAAITRYPSPICPKAVQLNSKEKIARIEEKMREVCEILGLDLRDDSLKDTPLRIAKMYVDEIFSGLNTDAFPKISCIQDKFHQEAPQTIIVKDITLNSFCEHHFVPFQGKAHVAYIPNGKVIGLSKINRLVNYFGKRPQVQERLTAQIADSLSLVLDTQSVAVSITAHHCCISSRGIQDQSSSTTTHVFLGSFKNNSQLKSEFFSSI